jgi:hypothetical protein
MIYRNGRLRRVFCDECGKWGRVKMEEGEMKELRRRVCVGVCFEAHINKDTRG